MSIAVHETLEAMAKRIKRELGDQEATAYEFADDGPWNVTLRRLPFSCRLWHLYRTWDEARRAHDEALTARRAMERELMEISRRIDEDARDPSIDDATWGWFDTRGRRLERALKDPHNLIPELKTNATRAEEAFGQAWHSYSTAVQEISRIERTSPVALLGGRYDGRGEQLQALYERKRYYEAPRGE